MNQDNLIIVKSDPSFEWERKTKKKKFPTVLKVVLCILLVAMISAGSVAGYVLLTGNRQPTAADPSESRINVVYQPAGTASAASTEATAPQGVKPISQIYAECVESAVIFTCKVPTQTTGSYYYGDFGDFFGFGGGNRQQQPVQQYGTAFGSGVILTNDGYILTNAHVVADASEVKVTLYDGREFTATVCGSDENTDVAVVKIEAENLKAAKFGDSSTLLVGDEAYAIGNPLGAEFAFTLTCGHISATEREISIEDQMMRLMQHDAAVSPGNSGGPLINRDGLVIGLVNAKIVETETEGIGFAIPINTVISIAKDLIDYGYVASRPMLGITVRTVTQAQAEAYGYEVGVTVTEVSQGSCAEAAGIRVGDKITRFNGIAISSGTELTYQKEKCKIGDDVTISVIRDGQEMTFTVHLTA